MAAISSNDKSSRWRKVVACAAGATVAGFAAPVIAAVGGSMLIAAVGAGAVSTAVSTITSNAMRPPIEQVRYHPEAAQRIFRNAVSQFLSTHFDPIIETIQRNRAANFGPLSFSVSISQAQGVLGFAYADGMSIFIEYSFRLRPRPGTPERDIEDSQPAPDLPNYTDPSDTIAYALPDDLRNANQSLFDGLGWAVLRGTAVGAVGSMLLPLAPAWYFLETAPGVAGIVYGIPTATGTASSAVEVVSSGSTPYERIAYSVHFASEIRLHVNRVLQCANRNGVELQYHIKAGMGKRLGTFVRGSVNEMNAGQGTDWSQVWYEDRSHLLPDGPG